MKGFQSIGVTKDWRQRMSQLILFLIISFQSIGVTKDWRLGYTLVEYPELEPVSNQ